MESDSFRYGGITGRVTGVLSVMALGMWKRRGPLGEDIVADFALNKSIILLTRIVFCNLFESSIVFLDFSRSKGYCIPG